MAYTGDVYIGMGALEAICAYFVAEAEAGRDNEVSALVRALRPTDLIGPVARAHLRRASRARGTGVLLRALVDDERWNRESDKALGCQLWLWLQPIVKPTRWDLERRAAREKS